MNSIDVLDSFLKHANDLASGGAQTQVPKTNLTAPLVLDAQPLSRKSVATGPVTPGGNTTTSGVAPKPLTDLKNPKIV
jgi:hypothetical protein